MPNDHRSPSFSKRVRLARSRFAGAVGYTMLLEHSRAGFQRGMFSNEAGMGSTPNAAAAVASWPPHPAAQGIVQMIGVFTDTIVICSASAIDNAAGAGA
ncbi:alanine:cation symporter family protein [Klebsiella pneumoniae]|nr:alanine:cation symporter family protein [Klebsiella pneumoniae]